MAQIPYSREPAPFSFKPEDWKDWKSEFLRYRGRTKLDQDAGSVQRDALIFYMGTKQAEQIMGTFTWGKVRIPNPAVQGQTIEVDEVDTMFTVLVNKFENYFVPQVNVINESTVFNTRVQNAGETVESFARSLQDLVKTCDYAEPQRMVRDRFVAGLRDLKLQEKLQFKRDLTLKTALEYARRDELIKGQVATQHKVEVDEVYHPRQGRGRGHRGRGGRGRGSSRGQGQGRGRGGHHQHHHHSNSSNSGTCSNCGKSHPDAPCPARGKACNYCHARGHFKSMCRKRSAADNKYGGARASANEVTDEAEGFFIGAVDCADSNEAWTVPLAINGKTVDFKIDTGADVSIISKSVYQSLPDCPELRPSQTKLMSPGGKLISSGEFIASTSYKGTKFRFRIIVVDQPTNCLLSRGAASKMGMVTRLEEISADLFGSSGLMKTAPVKIQLREDAVPHCVSSCRRIPFPIMKKVKAELERMEKAGIIKKIDIPTDWCSCIVPVIKDTGDVRVCIDLKKLNAAVKRPHYMLPNLDDIAPHLKGSVWYSTLDASGGFLQVPLDEESQPLTTFITPFGRYCCLRMPFGITSGPEEFQRRSSELLEGLPGVHVIMDDILVHGKTLEEHDSRLEAALERVRKSGMKLNRKKCQIRKKQLTYFGHSIGKDGIKPMPDKVKAIQELPPPKSVTELRTALGMINYLAKFTPGLSTLTKPLAELLKADVVWLWGQPQEDAFKKVKAAIADTHMLSYYDPKLPTIVSADASSYGLGAALLQQTPKGGLVPVAFASRTLTPAEGRYAQIEKECLASVWACDKFARYLVGLDQFRLLTDHKPLVPLMTSKDLDQAPVRCQRLLMRLMRFNPEVVHVPGKTLVIADALSRSPLPINPKEEPPLAQEVTEYIDALQALWPISTQRLNEIRQATQQDEVMARIMRYILHGWPQNVEDALMPYVPFRSELSAIDGLVVFRDRIVVPAALRPEMLDLVHESHQGISKSLENAGTCIWWPGISRQIKNVVSQCASCQQDRPSQRKEPLKPTSLPSRAWERVDADLFEIKGKHYLVVIDGYSRWIEIKLLPSTKTGSVVNRFNEILATHGVMDILKSDNGPQFVSDEFKAFAKEWGFQQTTSSPHFHQANGLAESAVRIAKKILSQKNPHRALLEYRSTPLSSTGVTPAEALMGRRLQTRLPVLAKNLQPRQPDDTQIRAADTRAKEYLKAQFDRRHGVRELPHLEEGQPVLMKLDTDPDWRSSGTVVRSQPDKRTYLVQTPTGILRRNRRHLQAVPKLPLQRLEPELEQEEEERALEQAPAPTVLSAPPAPAPAATPTGAPATPSSGMRRSSRALRRPDRLIEKC